MEQDLTIMVAPCGIVIGGGLVAIGGLTLFGYPWVVKTKTQGILAILAGFVILGALEIQFFTSSAAFFEAQKNVVSDCHLQAESTHGVQRGDQQIHRCLSKPSWIRMEPPHRRCQEATLAMNAYCYLPTGFFSRLITKMQLNFE